MGRTSIKENKSVYQLARENFSDSLTRAKAVELLDCGISEERLERIESGKLQIKPDEVLAMANAYVAPDLCNYYCANQCEIGKKYIPEIKIKDLSSIVLGALASLNNLNSKKERLVEITADGEITKDEYEDFYEIENQLSNISIVSDTLKMWIEGKLSSGMINKEEYEKFKNKKMDKK